MKSPIALTALAFAALAHCAPAIDFTLGIEDSIDDGIPFRRMFFTDGAQRIYYRPPTSWSRSGDANAATFRPKDSKQAVVMIQNAPSKNASVPFDAAGLALLRKNACIQVPPDATEVTETWEVVNPVILQGWTSFEVGLDYIQAGKHFCRSVLIINLDARRQIYFIVDAAPEEFDRLYKSAYRTLATWWEPTAENPG
jgi:hypothetical protein